MGSFLANSTEGPATGFWRGQLPAAPAFRGERVSLEILAVTYDYHVNVGGAVGPTRLGSDQS